MRYLRYAKGVSVSLRSQFGFWLIPKHLWNLQVKQMKQSMATTPPYQLNWLNLFQKLAAVSILHWQRVSYLTLVSESEIRAQYILFRSINIFAGIFGMLRRFSKVGLYVKHVCCYNGTSHNRNQT